MIRLETRNIQSIVANLYARNERVQREVRQLNRETVDAAASLLEQLAPRDTGFMASQAKGWLSEQTLSWSFGWDAADFAARGFAFYPVFLEFGTSRMEAQPTLGPVSREILPAYERDLSDILRRALAEGRQ